MAKDYKWYVVWEGRAPGIYNSWEECRLQTEGYEGAKYKSFISQEKATEAFRGDPKDQLGIIRSIAQNSTPKVINYAAIPDIIIDSIAVDASCLGNPGIMEYQGVDVKTGNVIFRKGPFKNGTNNIGEFLAIVHALALLKSKGLNTTIYSDSKTAISWVRKRKCMTTLKKNKENKELFEILERAIAWIERNEFCNRIIKWNTDEWGEIPADFGRK
ncbi:MAG: ribonuclease H family protein [Muribaculaceae bacterium]|nr:ribonuclease H family protein [Muribaculaceae bacterium]